MTIASRLRKDRSGSSTAPCTCGHTAEAHSHYRRGDDCALCSCEAFRPGAAPVPAPVDGASTPRTALRIG